MRKIAPELKTLLLSDSDYKKCLRQVWLQDHVCRGRITWEHAIIYKGQQLNERWAIIPICAYAHSVDKWQDSGILNKEINEWIAINRATDEELQAVSKAVNYKQKREYLNGKYKRIEGKLLQNKNEGLL